MTDIEVVIDIVDIHKVMKPSVIVPGFSRCCSVCADHLGLHVYLFCLIYFVLIFSSLIMAALYVTSITRREQPPEDHG